MDIDEVLKKMLKYSIFVPLIFIYTLALGQVCDGNFGDNIFESGDFGSGSSQVLMTNPQIAPGYTYQTNLPPEDGFYTIVSSLSANQVFFDWLTIEDNSEDENGYMMVVNANFEPGLFYEQTITGLCENVLYEFSADIFNLIASWSTDRIDPNVSFLLDDEEVFNTGDILKNEKWNTYGFTFTTKPGQSSLKLSLRNNAPGGTGNDLALDNITFRPCGSTALILPEDLQNICEDGEPFDIEATIIGSAFETTFIQWQESFDQGKTWVDLAGETDNTYTFDNLKSGDYYYRYLLADRLDKLTNSKCRTNSNTKVVRVIPKFVNVIDSLCVGLSAALGENILFTSGRHIDTLQNIIGCDSIVTLDLTFLDTNLQGVFNMTDPTCDYLSDGKINVKFLSSKGPYSVQVNNDSIAEPGDISGLPAGEYQYIITDRYGCQLDTLLSLIQPPVFEVDLGPDQTLNLGERFQIDGFVSDSASWYQWSPGSIDCEPPCESVSELFSSTTTVSLLATSLNECEASDEVTVNITEGVDIFIPNIITPNQDGMNDFFTIYPEGPPDAIEEVEALKIHDRMGVKFFERTSFAPGVPELGWDGTRDGNAVPSGVYYYSVSIKLINGQSPGYSGYVTLLK